MNFETIVKTIRNLEPLSDALLKVQEMFNAGQEELDIKKLIAIIESDVVLSVNILKMANSPLYGFSQRVTTVAQAVTLFGIMQIYGFLISYSTSERIKASTDVFGITNQEFNDICNIQSALLLEWYLKIDEDDAKFLAPLALIMETGKLVIANEVSVSEYKKEFQIGYGESIDIDAYERELLGTSSYGISAMVFKHWHLDPLYILILKNLTHQHSSSDQVIKYSQILNVIIASVNLKAILSKQSVMQGCKIVKKMGLNPEAFVQAALRVKKSYKSQIEKRENIHLDD